MVRELIQLENASAGSSVGLKPTVCLANEVFVTDSGREVVSSIFPTGLLVLAASVRDLCKDLRLHDPSPLRVNGPEGLGNYLDNYAEQLAAHKADVYGFTAMCRNFPYMLRVMRALRPMVPEAQIVLGGPHVTLMPSEVLGAFPYIDVVAVGEGEHTFRELIAAYGSDQLASVKGIVFRRRGNIIATPSREMMRELDDCPVPDFSDLPRLSGSSVFSLEVGRGCPKKCTFCSTAVAWGRQYRLKSPARIVQEIQHFRSHAAVKCIRFDHDNLAVDRKKFSELVEALEAADLGDVVWNCAASVDALDAKIIPAMKRAGCTSVFFGIEHWSPRIQRRIKKHLKPAAAREKIQQLVEAGITTRVNLIYGFPFETESEFEENIIGAVDSLRIGYANNYRVKVMMFQFTPLPGTPIIEEFGDRLELREEGKAGSFSALSEAPEHEREMIRAYPAIFASYYTVPPAALSMAFLDFFSDVARPCLVNFPLSFYFARLEGELTYVDLFKQLRTYLEQKHGSDWLAHARQQVSSATYEFLFDFILARFPDDERPVMTDVMEYEHNLSFISRSEEGAWNVNNTLGASEGELPSDLSERSIRVARGCYPIRINQMLHGYFSEHALGELKKPEHHQSSASTYMILSSNEMSEVSRVAYNLIATCQRRQGCALGEILAELGISAFEERAVIRPLLRRMSKAGLVSFDQPLNQLLIREGAPSALCGQST